MLKTKQISGLDTTLGGLMAKATMTAYSVMVKQASGDPVALTIDANKMISRASTGDIVANSISDWIITNLMNAADAAAVRTAIGAGTGGGSVTNVSGTGPISVATGTTTPVISISAATTSAAGSMSSADKTKLDGIAASANNYTHPNHSGDVTSTGDGATVIGANKVTNAMLAQITTATIKGRKTAATGNVEDLSKADVLTILNVADGAQVNVPTNLSAGTVNATTYGIASSTGTAHSIAAATTSLAGVMTGADKTKLDGIAAGAQVNVATNLSAGPVNATTYGIASSTGTAHSIAPATTSLAGVMTGADKTKLDGIAASANNYTHPTGDGNSHVPVTSTGNNGKVLKAGASANAFSWAQLVPSDSGFTIVTSVGASPSDDTTVASEKAVRTALNGILAANDAMVFKGVAVNAAAMPTNDVTKGFNVGCTYRATAAFTYGTSGTASNNIVVEIGDLITCIKDYDVSFAIATNVSTYWLAIQTNIDGAVTSIASGISTETIPVFNSTDKVIKSSGRLISSLQDKLTARYWIGNPAAGAAKDVAIQFAISTVFPTGTLSAAVPLKCSVNGENIPYSGFTAGGADTNRFYLDNANVALATIIYIKCGMAFETTDEIYITGSTV